MLGCQRLPKSQPVILKIFPRNISFTLCVSGQKTCRDSVFLFANLVFPWQKICVIIFNVREIPPSGMTTNNLWSEIKKEETGIAMNFLIYQPSTQFFWDKSSVEKSWAEGADLHILFVGHFLLNQEEMLGICENLV